MVLLSYRLEYTSKVKPESGTWESFKINFASNVSKIHMGIQNLCHWYMTALFLTLRKVTSHNPRTRQSMWWKQNFKYEIEPKDIELNEIQRVIGTRVETPEALVQSCSLKGFLRNFAKFTGKRLCQISFLIKLQASGLQLY